MFKYAIYLFAFALFLNAEVASCFLPKDQAIAESMRTVLSISVTTIIQNSKINAVRTSCFAQTPANKEPLLRMVRIRAKSSIEVRQLRGMHLDIVNIRPDPDRPPGGELLSGGFIVEAVVAAGQLAKLKKMGFEVSEMPEKN
jgi:hypothetical protein